MSKLSVNVDNAMTMERALHKFMQEVKNSGYPVLYNDVRNLLNAINATGDAADVLGTLYNIIEQEKGSL